MCFVSAEMTARNKSLFLLLLISCNVFVTFCIQCKNEDNKDVDWFVIYKLPRLSKMENSLIREGSAYVYMTSDDYSSWTFSKKSIGANDSIVGLTLSDLYANQETTTYVLYNDEPPNGKILASKGHTKGVVLANDEGGIWLIHSVPLFPSNDSFSFPSSGTEYGQSFLCISTDTNTIDTVGLQLQMNEPHVYDYNTDTSLSKSLPNLVKAATGKASLTETSSVKTIKSKNGVNFESFAKSKKFGKDLYAGLVAGTLKTDLDVEFWPKEVNVLPSDCSSTYKVYNVESIVIEVANINFTTTHDHSKWAVSTTGNYVCIGDINRAKSQEAKGGGTVCLNNQKLASKYQSVIGSIQPCSNEIF